MIYIYQEQCQGAWSRARLPILTVLGRARMDWMNLFPSPQEVQIQLRTSQPSSCWSLELDGVLRLWYSLLYIILRLVYILNSSCISLPQHLCSYRVTTALLNDAHHWKSVSRSHFYFVPSQYLQCWTEQCMPGTQ